MYVESLFTLQFINVFGNFSKVIKNYYSFQLMGLSSRRMTPLSKSNLGYQTSLVNQKKLPRKRSKSRSKMRPTKRNNWYSASWKRSHYGITRFLLNIDAETICRGCGLRWQTILEVFFRILCLFVSRIARKLSTPLFQVFLLRTSAKQNSKTWWMHSDE